MTTIIIEARVFPESENVTVWIDRDEPQCGWCGHTMDLLEEHAEGTKDQFSYVETWECPRCHFADEFLPFQYGDFSIEMTREEYESYKGAQRQEYYLHRRYPKGIPDNIADFWVSQVYI